MNIIFIFLLIIAIPNISSANCTFQEWKYIEDLKKFSSIEQIDIFPSNPRKYYKNFLKIYTSPDPDHINPKLRKKLKAEIIVKYKFGSCSFKAKIWQNGDGKDHIYFANGQAIRSLNIKLLDGNIINAVKFKLLIPETRKSFNEILLIEILKEYNILTPETFEVKVSQNGHIATLLFQEDARKELLERNKKTEGLLLEGDEGSYWTKNNYIALERSIALARSSNKAFLEKGENTLAISSSAFGIMQSAYALSRFLGYDYYLALEKQYQSTKKFHDFYSVLIAAGAIHGLHLNNRKFYFNFLNSKFEPIYYDGDAHFGRSHLNYISSDELRFPKAYELNVSKIVINRRKLCESALERSLPQSSPSQSECFAKLNNFLNNAEKLSQMTRGGTMQEINFTHRFRQAFISKNQKREIPADVYDEFFLQSQLLNSDPNINKNLISLLTRNQFFGRRSIYLPTQSPKLPTFDNQYAENGLRIKVYGKINVDVNSIDRSINIYQRGADGVALFEGGSVTGWSIFFHGLDLSDKSRLKNFAERRSAAGVTGCLTFYNVEFRDTKIFLQRGICEDQINIIDSTGQIEKLQSKNALQDGIDIDFSKLDIANLAVNGAGNDCVDISAGEYHFESLQSKNCVDKGLSAGESSSVYINDAWIENSGQGIAVKDSTIVEAADVKISNSPVCLSIYNKKLEYAGARASIKRLQCATKILSDEKSHFDLGSIIDVTD